MNSPALDAVEIKRTISSDKELLALRAMQVDEGAADKRLVYFYDTPNLDLYKVGIVLRARLIKDDKDDSTVKFRSIDALPLAENWQRLKLKGFKLEADWVGDHELCSASLTVLQRRDEIDEVAEGKRPIAKLFSGEQERFLSECRKARVDFESLRVLGPVRVLRWKPQHETFPHELTLEEWILPNGEDLVEVSIKVSPKEAKRAQEEFDAHLRELNLHPEDAQDTKTRKALEYFSRLPTKTGP